MNYLKISSVGLMEQEALSLIGASTKRGDNSKVGMFGSGLKYSIATMIRQEIDFKIFSGTTEYKITTEPVEFGKKTFNQILINGDKTSLTDSMGTEDWNGAWPFIREIYSNALDEGSASISVVEEITPVAGETIFFIPVNTSIEEVVNNFENYFVTASKHLYSDGKGNYIHSGVGFEKVYRKGITVYESKRSKALFSYDLANLEINESRVLKYSWRYKDNVARLIEGCTDSSIIVQFYGAISGGNKGLVEHECILSEYEEINASKEMKEFISDNKFVPVEIEFMLDAEDRAGRLSLPLKALKRFLKIVPTADISGMSTMGGDGESDGMYIIKTPSTYFLTKINDAVTMLNKTMYGERLTFPIKTCAFKADNVLGRFHNNTILLSTKLDTEPVEMIATIIIEEQEHGTTGFNDRTRNFQTHLFKLLFGAYAETGMTQPLREELEETNQKLEELARQEESFRLGLDSALDSIDEHNSKPWYKRLGTI